MARVWFVYSDAWLEETGCCHEGVFSTESAALAYAASCAGGAGRVDEYELDDPDADLDKLDAIDRIQDNIPIAPAGGGAE